jgi:hypothetical protein
MRAGRRGWRIRRQRRKHGDDGAYPETTTATRAAHRKAIVDATPPLNASQDNASQDNASPDKTAASNPPAGNTAVPKAGGKAKASKGKGRAPAVKGQPRVGKRRQSR